MRHAQVFLFSALMVCNFSFAQVTETVGLNVIDGDHIQQFSIQIGAPPPIGQASSLISDILLQNDIDCPPERTMVSRSVWQCGNGKLIRVESESFAALLDQAWN